MPPTYNETDSAEPNNGNAQAALVAAAISIGPTASVASVTKRAAIYLEWLKKH